jgi:hypothetical protein
MAGIDSGSKNNVDRIMVVVEAKRLFEFTVE